MTGMGTVCKAAGVLCILGGCAGWGLAGIGEEKLRICWLREMTDVLRRIRDEIGYGKRTLPEICGLLAECGGPLLRPVFRELYGLLTAGGGEIGRIWESRMESYMRHTPLSGEEKEILIRLPGELNRPEETLQAQTMERAAILLAEHCRQAEASYENKARVTFSLSLLSGVFLAILFL